MRATLPLLLLSSIVPATHGAATGPDHVWRRQNSDDQVIAAFADQGHCFHYLEKPNRDKSLAPCKIWCEKEGSSSYGCLGPNLSDEDMKKMPVNEDDDGNEFVVGTCKCEFPLAEEIATIVLENLEKLDNVLCAVALEALKMVVDIGTSFIPGVGQVKTATRLAVEAAKTVAENAMPPEGFSSWVGAACNLDDWDFDPVDAFIPLSEMPDSLGTSIGCLRKNKKECKKLDPKPDPKPTDRKGNDDGPKPTNTKPDNNNPNPTTTKSTDSPSDTSCDIGKPEDCGVECSNVDVWGDELDDVFAEPEDVVALPVEGYGLATRGLLAKRDVKIVQLCGLSTTTEDFPPGKKLANSAKVSGTDIIYGLARPDRCDDFDFVKRSVSLYPTYDRLHGQDRLQSEHVLEAQMVDIFFQHVSESLGQSFDDPFDPTGQNKVDFCTYVKTYWSNGYGNPLPDIDGSGKVKQAVKWLADQYPTTMNRIEEFLLLPGRVNQLKEKAWNTRNKVVVDPKPIEKQLRQSDFVNKSVEKSDILKAILKYKNMIFLYKYHTETTVQDILKEQSRRIADTLDKLEDTIVGLDFSKRQPPVARPYKKWNLKQAWEGWIPTHTDNAISKINKFFDENRDDYLRAKARLEAEVKKDPKMNRGVKAKYDRIIGLIDRCEQEYKKLPVFVNPFTSANPLPAPDSDSDTDMDDV